MENKDEMTIQNKNASDTASKTAESSYLLKSFTLKDDDMQGEIPRETLRNVYGNDFEELANLLDIEEENSKNYFHDIINDLDERYTQFKSNMSAHLIGLTNKITDAFNLENNIPENNKSIQNSKSILVQKYSKEYLQIIKKIIIMHKQILECIKETISILFNFLDISKFLDNGKPIQEFLEKEFENIIKSWLFLKLDLEKFDFVHALNASDLDNNFKNFIFKICQGKNFVMNITLPKKYILEENINYLPPKIKENLLAEKIKNKNILRDNCNNLTKLQNLSMNITKLSLSNNGFINSEFNNIVNNYLKKSNSIRHNLEYLSFANNNLSYIDFTQMITSQKTSFIALKALNFGKNKIYKFNIPFEYFSELQCINCCYNSFSRNNFTSNEKIIVLQGGNPYLTNFIPASKYYTDLEKKLNSYHINLVYLNLSFIPSVLSNEYLSNLKINDTILLGLKKIDLSYNNITNIVFFNFIENNKGIFNIKYLNLSGNKLDDLFFEIYLNLKLNNKFTKLSKINLNENLFGDDNIEVTYNPEEGKIISNQINKIRLFYRFIYENKVLTDVSIIRNKIFNEFKILDFYKNSENHFKKDIKGNIIINCLNSFLYKIKTELLLKDDGQNYRNSFNLKFDSESDINQNSEDFTYEKN